MGESKNPDMKFLIPIGLLLRFPFLRTYRG